MFRKGRYKLLLLALFLLQPAEAWPKEFSVQGLGFFLANAVHACSWQESNRLRSTDCEKSKLRHLGKTKGTSYTGQDIRQPRNPIRDDLRRGILATVGVWKRHRQALWMRERGGGGGDVEKRTQKREPSPKARAWTVTAFC